jgi:hypothetical protein
MEINILKANSNFILDKEDTSLSEAIYTMYKNEEGPIIKITWNGLVLPIDGITLSHLINDLSKMVSLLKQDKQNFSIHFLDNAFTAEWHCTQEGKKLSIASFWTTVRGYSKDDGSLENLRNQQNESIDKVVFLKAMQTLFTSIKEDLKKAGYDKAIEDYEQLEV